MTRQAMRLKAHPEQLQSLRAHRNWLALFCLCSTLSISAFAKPFFVNHQELVESSNFGAYYGRAISKIERVKIAVLDNGFRGYRDEIGKTLPADTDIQFAEGPLTPPEPQETHGLVMAQIVSELMTNGGIRRDLGPQLFLFNSYGFTNFNNAIDQAIQSKVDVILYSQVWEYGGNNDGHGFINTEVNRALSAGILWVNAAGDFGQTTFNSAIQNDKDDWIHLPNSNNSVEVECRTSSMGNCPIRIVASWNDYKDQVDSGTLKDLDLYLFDDTLNLISSSGLRQVEKIAEDKEHGEVGYSLYPREIIQTEVKSGRYLIRLKNRSLNFKDRDRLRITVSGEGLILPGADLKENLLVPADNSGVITVAGTELRENSRSVKLHKPDLIANSTIKVPKGFNGSPESLVINGSSVGAALVTAGIGLVKSFNPTWKHDQILKTIKGNRTNLPTRGDQPGLLLSELQFGPIYKSEGTSRDFGGVGDTRSGERSLNCFQQVMNIPALPAYLNQLTQAGGVPVFTTAGVKVFFTFDPAVMAPLIHRTQANDLLVITPNGYMIFPRYAMTTLSPTYYEAVQIPRGQSICGLDNFRTPNDNSRPNVTGRNSGSLQPPNFWLSAFKTSLSTL